MFHLTSRMHKVLIIGSTGMLGSALIARYGVRQAFGIDHSLVDIADKVELTAFLKQARPRLIINAAAYNAVDACEESQEEALRAFSVNGDGVQTLRRMQPATTYRSFRSARIMYLTGAREYILKQILPNPRMSMAPQNLPEKRRCKISHDRILSGNGIWYAPQNFSENPEVHLQGSGVFLIRYARVWQTQRPWKP